MSRTAYLSEPAYATPGPALEDLSGVTGARTALSIYLVLLLALPQQLIIAPVGFTGSPAMLWGVGCFLWWVLYHLNRPHRVGRPRVVRWTALLLVGVVVASYTHAMTAPMAPDEISVADGGLIRILSWVGVAMLAADGLVDLHDWRRLIDWMLVLVGLLALLGIVQALTDQAWVDRISIPGLVSNAPVELTAAREGHPRPIGTATHAIEFGQVLTLGLLVSAAALSARPSRANRLVALACGVAALFVVSRSAVVSIVVGFLVLAFSFTRRQRYQGLGAGVVVLLAAFMLRPGLLGTLGRLFTGIGGDASARSRTDSYAYAFHAFASHPVLGKGFGTFLPKYRILDNQWLLGAIELGAVGVVALLLFFAAVVRSGLRGERGLEARADRVVARSLTASVVAVCVGMLFYDGFSFPQATGLLFVVCGLAAAAHRLTEPPVGLPAIEPGPRPRGLTSYDVAQALVRRWWVVLGSLAASVALVHLAAPSPPLYWSRFELNLVAPDRTGEVLSRTSAPSGVTPLAGALEILLAGNYPGPRAASQSVPVFGLEDRPTVQVMAEDKGFQWSTDYVAALAVQIAEPTNAEVRTQAAATGERARAALAALQVEEGVPPRLQVRMETPLAIDVVEVVPARKRELVGAFVLGTAGSVLLALVADAWLLGRRASRGRPGRSSSRRYGGASA